MSLSVIELNVDDEHFQTLITALMFIDGYENVDYIADTVDDKYYLTLSAVAVRYIQDPFEILDDIEDVRDQTNVADSVEWWSQQMKRVHKLREIIVVGLYKGQLYILGENDVKQKGKNLRIRRRHIGLL